MPKQFRTKLAGAIVTLAMVAAPVAAFAGELDGGADIGMKSIETLPGDAVDSYYPEDDLNGGQGGEIGTFDKTQEVETPQVDEDTLNKPVSEGLGPLGGVMPTLDENGNNTNKVPNTIGTNNNKPSNKKPSTTTTTNKKTTSKKTSWSKKTTSNPKTGDVSVLSYAGLGLVSVAGLLRKRK